MKYSNKKTREIIITAGSTYLDIDAYACCVAMKELLILQGINAIAYSKATYNYSVCRSLIEEGQVYNSIPADFNEKSANYIIVDVSDPEYIKESVPLERVCRVYDHHTGFEDFWKNRIGDNSHIEFIGAAATLIYLEWKQAGLQKKMRRSTALLLIAAILDNTLNLTSSNTTDADRNAFKELCDKESIGKEWCDLYFSDVQTSVEADLKNALFHDIKIIHDNRTLPARLAQICVWDALGVLDSLPQIRAWFKDCTDSWMINIIDIHSRCSYFVIGNLQNREDIEKIFDITFESDVAKSPVLYLRKEIIKKVYINDKLKE